MHERNFAQENSQLLVSENLFFSKFCKVIFKLFSAAFSGFLGNKKFNYERWSYLSDVGEMNFRFIQSHGFLSTTCQHTLLRSLLFLSTNWSRSYDLRLDFWILIFNAEDCSAKHLKKGFSVQLSWSVLKINFKVVFGFVSWLFLRNFLVVPVCPCALVVNPKISKFLNFVVFVFLAGMSSF